MLEGSINLTRGEIAAKMGRQTDCLDTPCIQVRMTKDEVEEEREQSKWGAEVVSLVKDPGMVCLKLSLELT